MRSATPSSASAAPVPSKPRRCHVAVIWIDWYPYHVARFRGLLETPELADCVAGIELVGGVGVHAGLKFREPLPKDLPVTTLERDGNWQTTPKLRLSVRLWKELTRLDPDLVLVPGYYTLPGVVSALWARAHNRSSVLMSESTEQDHPRNVWRERAKSASLRFLFDWAVVGGIAHRRYLARLDFPPERVVGFYDVVDNAAIARAVAERRNEAKGGITANPFFLFVGRLAPEKNVLGLVRCWLEFRRDGGTWDLVLAGDGPEREAIDQLPQASPFPESVTLTGLLTADQLIPLYAAAGCFVLPSTREPWGLVVNEAMAASLPVLVSRHCGAAADLVRDGENGYTFHPSRVPGTETHDPPHSVGGDLLVDLLHRIASLSPGELREMGDRSAGRIAAFSPRAFGREIARVFQAEWPDARSPSVISLTTSLAEHATQTETLCPAHNFS